MRKLFSILIIFSCIMLLGCQEEQAEDISTNPPQSMPEEVLSLQVTGYEKGSQMPAKYATVAGGGENISIGLTWQPLPAAKSYAMLFDDKHPVANFWVHWLVVDIPITEAKIPEGASRTGQMPPGSRELMTSWGKTGYDGPQPPVGSGNHEYVATLYALDTETLAISENVSRYDFLNAIQGHLITEEGYSGFFER